MPKAAFSFSFLCVVALVGCTHDSTGRPSILGPSMCKAPSEPCYDAIPACLAHAPDISDSVVQAVVAYVRTLGVPVRRNVHASIVQQGAQLFASAGCSGCHTPTLTTGKVPGEPELSNQTIHPYTDMLVHDMGPALADNRPDFAATGTQWRTRPLWGIGLTPLINGRVNFLHDGRAQSILEAIMWHGGQPPLRSTRCSRCRRRIEMRCSPSSTPYDWGCVPWLGRVRSEAYP